MKRVIAVTILGAAMLAGCSQSASTAAKASASHSAPAAASPAAVSTVPLSATWAAKINAVDTGYPKTCVKSTDGRCLAALRKIMDVADGLNSAITTGHREAQYPSTLSYLGEMTMDWRYVQGNCVWGNIVQTSDAECLDDVLSISSNGTDISGMQPDSVGVLKKDEAAAKKAGA